jgi:2-desacetyl-2-hydroxyethyl bacteriochlorophyllide A dehydrogenase
MPADLPTTIRQFWIHGPSQAEIRVRELPPGQDDEVLVRALYSGVSRGTEALVFRGEVPPSQHVAMRAPFQEGSLPGAITYGYASVGRVVATGNAVRSVGTGDTVFSLHTHQDAYWIPASAVVRLPDGLPPERAVLAANMETALNATWDGAVAPGDRVVVVGAGTVGLLTARLCASVPGTRITVVDPNPAKERAARALGLELATAIPPEAGADLAFHASGSPSGLRDALRTVGPEGTVVELSWFGTESVCLPLGEEFHAKRLVLRSSQVGEIPPNRRPRWSRSRRLATALDLLLDSAFDALITGESDFEDLPDVLARLSRNPGDEILHRIRYGP